MFDHTVLVKLKSRGYQFFQLWYWQNRREIGLWLSYWCTIWMQHQKAVQVDMSTCQTVEKCALQVV